MKVLLLAATLSIANILPAHAAEDAMAEAFPSIDQPNVTLQMGVGTAEIALGGTGVAASRLVGDGSSDNPKEFLDRKLREIAREEVIAQNPNYAKSLAAQDNLAAHVEFERKWGTSHEYDARRRVEAIQKEIASLSDDFAKGDAMFKSKLSGYYANLKSGKQVPKTVEGVFKRFKQATKQGRILAAGSAVAVIDGGWRMLELANKRDPGISPAIIMGRSAIKSALKPTPESAPASTTMSVE